MHTQASSLKSHDFGECIFQQYFTQAFCKSYPSRKNSELSGLLGKAFPTEIHSQSQWKGAKENQEFSWVYELREKKSG